jgi:hypothetical protein
MPSEIAIDIFALLNFAVLGLSLLLQPLAWAHFFGWLRREGTGGAMAYGFICLSFGSLLVAFHRGWFGVLVVVTIAGWLEVLVGLVCLLSPAAGLRILALPSEDRLGVCRIGGIVSLALAAVILVALLPLGI